MRGLILKLSFKVILTRVSTARNCFRAVIGFFHRFSPIQFLQFNKKVTYIFKKHSSRVFFKKIVCKFFKTNIVKTLSKNPTTGRNFLRAVKTLVQGYLSDSFRIRPPRVLNLVPYLIVSG